jgi:hypothetical protein
MVTEMWEYARHDWLKLRSSGSAAKVPEAVEQLRLAATDHEADAAYWRIDNEVVVQGALYEACVPTAVCLVGALQNCTAAARPKILELLFQLGNGEPHPTELVHGNADLAARCRTEIRHGATLVFSALECATPEWIDVCVDLLILCADEDRSLESRVAWYFQRILASDDLFIGLRETLERWLTEHPQ